MQFILILCNCLYILGAAEAFVSKRFILCSILLTIIFINCIIIDVGNSKAKGGEDE